MDVCRETKFRPEELDAGNGQIHGATEVELVPQKTCWSVAPVQFMVPCGFRFLDVGNWPPSLLRPNIAAPPVWFAVTYRIEMPAASFFVGMVVSH